MHTTIAPPVDVIEEIKKYKALMEDMIIFQEEFEENKLASMASQTAIILDPNGILSSFKPSK